MRWFVFKLKFKRVNRDIDRSKFIILAEQSNSNARYTRTNDQ